MKYITVLILILLVVPNIAFAGFFDIIGNIFTNIACFLTGFGCPDPCMQLISYSGGTAAYRLCMLVDRIAGILYIIGWSLATVVIIWGGITIMTSGSNEEQMKKGKKVIINGLIGATVIVCSGIILSLLLQFLQPLFLPM